MNVKQIINSHRKARSNPAGGGPGTPVDSMNSHDAMARHIPYYEVMASIGSPNIFLQDNEEFLHLYSTLRKLHHTGAQIESFMHKGKHSANAVQKCIIKVEVIDTGCGIPADRMANLYQLLSLKSRNITNIFTGAGLGLYITKALLNLMGGTIHCKSIENQGSIFMVKLPAEIHPNLISTFREPTMLLDFPSTKSDQKYAFKVFIVAGQKVTLSIETCLKKEWLVSICNCRDASSEFLRRFENLGSGDFLPD